MNQKTKYSIGGIEMIKRMEFRTRREDLVKQIRELHESGKSQKEIDEQMLILDGMMQDLEEEEEEFENSVEDE